MAGAIDSGLLSHLSQRYRGFMSNPMDDSTEELTRRNLADQFLLAFPEIREVFDDEKWWFTMPDGSLGSYLFIEMFLTNRVLVPGALGIDTTYFAAAIDFFERMISSSDSEVVNVADLAIVEALLWNGEDLRDAALSSPELSLRIIRALQAD